MSKVSFTCLALSPLLFGCAAPSTLAHATATFRALRAEREAVERAGVTITAKAITPSTWKRFAGVATSISWMAINQNTIAFEGAAPSGSLRREEVDVPILSMPSFFVSIRNDSGHTLVIDETKIRLEAGEQSHPMIALEELQRCVTRSVRDRTGLDPFGQNEIYLPVSKAVDALPLLGHARTIPDQGEWHGYLPFDVGVDQPLDKVTLHLSGLQLDGAPAPELPLAFTVERRMAGVRVCPDGKEASSLGVCPSDAFGFEPADDGPCIQETAKPTTTLRHQLWIGSTMVADSDVHRTLLANKKARRDQLRAIGLKWGGWSVAGFGIMSAVGISTGVSLAGNHDQGPAGTAALALVPVGIGLVVIANRLQDRAIRRYNELADTTGSCAPVW